MESVCRLDEKEEKYVHSRIKKTMIAFSATIVLCGGAPSEAQPPSREIDEIIVLLRPTAEGGPDPTDVVNMINNGQQPGQGLGEGNPSRARLAIPRRATGRVL